jgi:hypothetical protein
MKVMCESRAREEKNKTGWKTSNEGKGGEERHVDVQTNLSHTICGLDHQRRSTH